MKIVAIIQARCGSKRLPRKHLLKVLGKPIIWYLIKRLKKIELLDEIVLATTKNKEDKELVKIAKKLNIKFFCGSENDVLGRVTDVAKKYKADIIFDVSGDCPLIDPVIAEQAIKTFLENKYIDYLSTHWILSYPDGLNINIITKKFLMMSNKLVKGKIERDGLYALMFRHPDKFKTLFMIAPKYLRRPEISLLLDEFEDYIFLKKIISQLVKQKGIYFSCLDIIKLLDKNKKLKKINIKVKRNLSPVKIVN
jgi:spore coat polysaccharide biosynthesis protein SpsF